MNDKEMYMLRVIRDFYDRPMQLQGLIKQIDDNELPFSEIREQAIILQKLLLKLTIDDFNLIKFKVDTNLEVR